MPIQKITSGIIEDGAVSAADIVSVSNTAITGNIISSQIAPNQTLNGNLTVSGTGFTKISTGTTAERPTSNAAGYIRYNSSRNAVEYWDANNSTWSGLGLFSAVGGTITNAGGYTIHTFTSSSTLTVLNGTISSEVLVVAGGGSGGWDRGGGGGAGGLVYHSALSLTPGNYTATVGAGGSNTGVPGVTRISGNPSVFGSITAVAGGGGGNAPTQTDGVPGGSGGGAAGPGVGGSTTQSPSGGGTGYGNAGGNGSPGPAVKSGGGGGAGGAGTAGTGPQAGSTGVGGAGAAYSLSGSSVFYAGGGGSGAVDSGSGAAGGSSIGGTGAGAGPLIGTLATAGTTNSGSGGGGGGNNPNTAPGSAGAAGGSGIVIVRYLTP